MASLTPMMQQYMEIKNQYKDCILFFRLGDFYEMFFSDAELASRELEITLTGRECGQESRAPMCGVPYHSSDTYIARLINKGHKVAICEQLEDPSEAKGIVRRDVIRVVTPGTILDSNMLDEKRNNFLMVIYGENDIFSLSICDVSTGDFFSTKIITGNTKGKLFDEISKYSPSEIIINSSLSQDDEITFFIKKKLNIYVNIKSDKDYIVEIDNEFLSSFKNIYTENNSDEIRFKTIYVLLNYIKNTQKVDLKHIQEVKSYEIADFLSIDFSSRRNLELTETMREKSRKGSLLGVIDKTNTSMGGRLLRNWIEQPLICSKEINDRLDSVEELKDNYVLRCEIINSLKNVYDIERLIGKVVFGSANCRDLVALKNSCEKIPSIRLLMKGTKTDLNQCCYSKLDELSDIYNLINNAIVNEPPISVKDGGIIKDGYNSELDRLHIATTEGKNWVADLEMREKEKTGIKNLKVGFNKVFGYYLEVTKSNYSSVPEHFIRKQTLANCERYITTELKDVEETILGAEDKIVKLEYELFCEIRDNIAKEVKRIKDTAYCLSIIDVITSLAEVAEKEKYIKPIVDNSDEIKFVDGRHPVVEKLISNESFVPNDLELDLEENRISIITGPNMAGKSTFMRQNALMVLMAQAGSFVPASYAKIGVVDKIFTRVGASDDLASGQSTFMVEMNEVANILKNSSKRSLLILDEIGRGTSTFDGLSIAWAVIEYIADKKKIGARTLFATHYHELTELEGKIKGIKNYCISVEEKGEDVVFLRKIIRGGADNSYGIEVAKLAGLPKMVLNRAKEILDDLQASDVHKNKKSRKSKKVIDGQLDFFAISSNQKASNKYENLILEIEKLDISCMTPLDTMNFLYKIQERIKKGLIDGEDCNS